MMEACTETSLSIYVYYKIPADKHQYYLSAIRALNNSIAALYPDVKVSKQKRPHMDKEGRELWMEIYHGIPDFRLDKFTTDLTMLAEKNNLPRERRVEIFLPL